MNGELCASRRSRRRRSTIAPFTAAIAAAIVVITEASIADAHDVGLSRGDYALRGDVVSAELTLSGREIAGAAPELDPDHDGLITAEELARSRGALQRAIVDRARVTADGSACPGSLTDASLTEGDGLVVRASYRCPKAPAKATVELSLLDDLPHGHRHIARARGVNDGDSAIERVLFRSQKTLELPQSSSADPDAGGSTGGAGSPSFVGFFVMGIEHILLGYDHLLFLLGLVLVGGKLRSMLLVVTAFTVAHSITLGAAALGLFAPSPRIVEPMIALSIAYVGVENFFVKDAEKRWRITFPFGLIHGFGFAGALGEIRLPTPEIPVALVSFNLGVEAGQLAVLSVVLPLIVIARRRAWFEDRGVKIVSALIAAAGLFWFVTRALGLDLG